MLSREQGCPRSIELRWRPQMIVRPRSRSHHGSRNDISSEVLPERGTGFRQVQVAVDAAELTIGIEHPGSAPVQGYRLSRQHWTFLQCSR
jgi:hypothetical protein